MQRKETHLGKLTSTGGSQGVVHRIVVPPQPHFIWLVQILSSSTIYCCSFTGFCMYQRVCATVNNAVSKCINSVILKYLKLGHSSFMKGTRPFLMDQLVQHNILCFRFPDHFLENTVPVNREVDSFFHCILNSEFPKLNLKSSLCFYSCT